MKIHEYQAKAILAKYDVPVPRGEVAYTVEETEAAAKRIGGSGRAGFHGLEAGGMESKRWVRLDMNQRVRKHCVTAVDLSRF